MQYAIELYFDKDTERALFHLARRVADAGLSTQFMDWKTRPHLTLACFNDVDEEKAAEQLRAFAQSQPVILAYMGSLGMFPDTRTIFASPVMTRGMYQLQEKIHERFKEYDATGWEWYCPDRWVPHCTLAMTRDEDEDVFYRASDLLLHEFRKIGGAFVALGLVKITRPVEEICTAALRG